MTVSAVAAGSTTSVKSSSQSLAANFDNFLKLLTTQLQNQDPLAPMDANAFTSQLVQFASVEQAISTNTKLGELGKLIETSGTASAMGMLGRRSPPPPTGSASRRPVVRRSATSCRKRSPRCRSPCWMADGRVVRSLSGASAAGENLVRWDGTDKTAAARRPASTRCGSTATRADGTEVGVGAVRRAAPSRAIEPNGSEISLVVDGAGVPMGACPPSAGRS